MRLILAMILIVGACLGWKTVSESYGQAPAPTGGPFRVTMAESCGLPVPTDKASMVFAGYYEGAAVSSVHLQPENSQDEGTRALDLHVQPGFAPIYLVLVGSRSAIVRFTGWTKRLERVIVVTESAYPSGVTGLPRDLVMFVSKSACAVDPHDLYDLQGRPAPISLSGLVKRPQPGNLTDEQRRSLPPYRMPDAVGGGYDPASISIGTNEIDARMYPSGGHDPALPDWQAHYADYDPAGVYEVDSAALISPALSEPYTLLPGRLGIAQLVHAGKLEDRGLDQFRVLAPITVPAGLYGAQAVTFEVPGNVAMPVGDLGHSRMEAR